MKWYIYAFKHYADFAGRASRPEYWYFVLFNVIACLVLAIIDGVTGMFSISAGIGVLSGIYSLIALIPGIAVGVRRLHDTNRSGWWMLIGIIPVVGPIVLIVFLVQQGPSEQNEYGAVSSAIPA